MTKSILRVSLIAALLMMSFLVGLPTTAGAESPPMNGGVFFIENAGQFDESLRYLVWGGDATTWLAQDAQWITVTSPVETEGQDVLALDETDDQELGIVNLRLSFVDANPTPEIVPLDEIDTNISFMRGLAEDWRIDVPVWSGVRYVDLYPGLDLEVLAQNGQIIRQLIVKDEQGLAALSTLRLRIEGADELFVDDCSAYAATPLGEIGVPLLYVTAEEGLDVVGALAEDAQQPTVEGDEIVAPFTWGNVAAHPIGADHPDALLYGNYLGGEGYECANAVAVDAAGAAYVAGRTGSADFVAASGPGYDTTYGGMTDAFVVKIASDGLSMTYATFLGGSAKDFANALTLTDAGQAIVVGETYSADFPAASGPGYDTTYSDEGDVFVVRLAADGCSLDYATYVGGSKAEQPYSVALTQEGSVWVGGETEGAGLPMGTRPALQDSYGGYEYDAFLFELSSDGLTLEYASYLGGSAADRGGMIALDSQDAVYLALGSQSTDLPSASATATSVGSHDTENFLCVFKLAADGASLEYSTCLEGEGTPQGIAVDSQGAAYVAGFTLITDLLPEGTSGFDTTFDGEADGFVIKFSPEGTPEYGTFLGGSSMDLCERIVVDSTGTAYVAGESFDASDFPMPQDAGYLVSSTGDAQGFVVRLSADGTKLLGGSYFGSLVTAIALDSDDNVYAAGRAEDETGLPGFGPGFATSYVDDEDGFIAKHEPMGDADSYSLWFYLPVLFQQIVQTPD